MQHKHPTNNGGKLTKETANSHWRWPDHSEQITMSERIGKPQVRWLRANHGASVDVVRAGNQSRQG